jgi:hypothetical protein
MPKGPWAEAGVEPRISDLLSDPIVQTLMRADGVHGADLHMIVFRDDNRKAAAQD